MKTKELPFKFKNKKFTIKARKCSIFNSGLMFKKSDTLPCLFEFRKKSNFKITSLFVFFPFVAVWLNSKNKVVDLKIVKPFTLAVSSDKSHHKLLEIPLNKKYNEITKFLVGD